MQLRDWQQQLQQVVLSGSDNPTLLLRQGSINRQQQLAIYSNAYRLRLTEALRSNFSALHQLLGDDDFNAMADRFISNYPPAHASIRWFGGQLPAFLAENAPFNSVPAIAELARFEWALRHAIDAADGTPPTVEELQQLPPAEWGDLRFDLHSSLTILEFNWNTPQIWRALDNDLDPPQPEPATCLWLVYRKPDISTHWRSAEQQELSVLNIWHEGGSFNDVCNCLLEQSGGNEPEDVIALRAATYLKTWVEQGLLVYRPRSIQ